LRLLFITLLVIAGLGFVLLNILDIGNTPDLSQSYMNASAPEIETAESYYTLYYVWHSTWLLDDEACEDVWPISKIPSHTLINEIGERHSILELVEITHALECYLGKPFNSLGNEEEIQLIQGRSVRLEDGSTLRGSDQLMRAFSIMGAIELFKSELRLGRIIDVEPIPSREEDPCEAIMDIALNGSTIEIRFAAFYALHFLYPKESDRPQEAACPQFRDEPDEVLIEQAMAGDIEAAINLSQRRSDQFIEEYQNAELPWKDLPEDEQIAQMDEIANSKLADENAKIADALPEYPLLALTYSVSNLFLHLMALSEEMEELEPLWEEINEKYGIDIPEPKEDN